MATLSPHVYAVADQAWRMIVSETKDHSPPLSVWKGAGRTQSCCAIFEYDPAGWGTRASRPYTGPDYTFNIINQWLRCAATAHSITIHTFSSPPSCALAFLLPYNLRIDLHALAHAQHL